MGIDLMHMPKLGFGLMRLPEKDGEIEMEKVCRMTDAYMEAGLNYFDTAYVYHHGLSEVAMREAVVKRYPREKVILATKLPIWEVHAPEDRDRIFGEQLERAGVSYFDFYLLHSIEDANVQRYEKYQCFEWAMQKKKEGKIRHLGFSFHGTPELLEKVLDDHPETEFVQIQLNYADWNNPIVYSGRLYEILSERKIPIIVMEPVKGGTLANPVPGAQEIFDEVRPGASPASWALRFVGSLPGVMTILSGMSNEEQMRENLATFADFEPLSEKEQEAVRKVTALITDKELIGCTSCRYCCDGCPQAISIPDIISAVNTVRLYEETTRPKLFYNGLTRREGKASSCIECGQCESVCPQHLPIISLMKEAAEILEK